MCNSVLKYDTLEKRIAFVKEKGNIVTFKEQFYPNGTLNQGFTQIAITGFKKDKSGAAQIIGFGHDSLWYASMNNLLDAIDWEKMEEWHS